MENNQQPKQPHRKATTTTTKSKAKRETTTNRPRKTVLDNESNNHRATIDAIYERTFVLVAIHSVIFEQEWRWERRRQSNAAKQRKPLPNLPINRRNSNQMVGSPSLYDQEEDPMFAWPVDPWNGWNREVSTGHGGLSIFQETGKMKCGGWDSCNENPIHPGLQWQFQRACLSSLFYGTLKKTYSSNNST